MRQHGICDSLPALSFSAVGKSEDCLTLRTYSIHQSTFREYNDILPRLFTETTLPLTFFFITCFSFVNWAGYLASTDNHVFYLAGSNTVFGVGLPLALVSVITWKIQMLLQSH